MTPGVGSSPNGAKLFVSLLVPLGKALYSNCSVVRRSRKAVGPVYMYLNINTSVHVKERHRLFVKSRGSSRYCWLYFKTTLIYSRFQSMGQGRLWPVWVPWPLGSKWNVGQYHRRRRRKKNPRGVQLAGDPRLARGRSRRARCERFFSPPSPSLVNECRTLSGSIWQC